MHPSTVLAILSAALISAAPSTNDRRGAQCPGRQYVCSFNGFIGDCSVDPCAMKWCPDYEDHSCVPVKKKAPRPADLMTIDATQCKDGAFFQTCSNGFRGCCEYDACTLGYCPTEKPAVPATTDETRCKDGKYFQVCSSGFRGCCKSDACALGYCPADTVVSEPPTKMEPVVKPVVSVVTDNTQCNGNGYFQTCGNGFRGCCKYDACTLGYCPGEAPVVKRQTDETVCAPGTGYFQSCGNGFRGCCKTDACARGYCPADAAAPVEKVPTEKVPVVKPVVTVVADGSICPPNTGYFQSCSNGFRGCCKSDACALGYCPQYY